MQQALACSPGGHSRPREAWQGGGVTQSWGGPERRGFHLCCGGLSSAAPGLGVQPRVPQVVPTMGISQ